MSVRIRMKKLGRSHRPFFRVCVMDQRSPRDGRVIEEVGYYDPMCPETDARTVLKADRIDHWLSVGAQPSDKVGVLIKKYGTDGTHIEAQKAALDRLGKRKDYMPSNEPAPAPKPESAPPKAESPAEGETAAETEAAAETATDTDNKTEEAAAE